jgi:hypothetical protein
MNYLGLLTLLSSFTLAIGSIALLLFSVIPPIFPIGGLITSLIMFSLSLLIFFRKKIAEIIAFSINVLLIISSSLSSAHVNSLLQIGHGLIITILDVLMVLSFYVFPGVYITLFLYKRSRRG